MPDRNVLDDCNPNVNADKSFTFAFGIPLSTAIHVAFAAAAILYAVQVLTPLRLTIKGITYLSFADSVRDGAYAKPLNYRPETLQATEGIVGR